MSRTTTRDGTDHREFLRGVGEATIDRFHVRHDTHRRGEAPSGPPTRESIPAVSMHGAGRRPTAQEE